MIKIFHPGRPTAAVARAVILPLLALGLAGCTLAGSSGPSTRNVLKASEQNVEAAGIKVIDVTDAVARRVAMHSLPPLFSNVLGETFVEGTVIGPGDQIDVTVIEAPPAVLFSGAFGGTQTARTTVAPTTSSRAVELPSQTVEANGRITVPFAGSVPAAGRTPQQIERDIAARLRGKAHDPQIIVRRVGNATSNVTVIGEVSQSGRFPVGARGERLLDAIALAGGPKQPIGKTLVQVTRGDRSATLPLDAVVRDPRQNVVLQANDVVTVFYQPYSFTALGAVGNNAEINFEGTGLTLAQALGRVGGLQDNRADIKGAFIFRFEDPAALDPAVVAGARTTPEGRIPVIYRVDMRNPATLFVAQNFAIKNKDVLYVSNAPLTDFAKFVNIVSGLTFSVVNIGNAVATP